MRNNLLFSFLMALIITGLYMPGSFSQSPTYTCTLANDTLYAPGNVYEFDVYLLRTGTTAFELGGFQIGLTYDTLALNHGTLTAAWVTGKTDPVFPVNGQLCVPAPFAQGNIKIASFQPEGHGNGTIIPNVAPGARVGRLRLTNTVPFAANPLSATWNYSNYSTKISAYVAGINTDITNQASFLNTLANAGNNKCTLTLTALVEALYVGGSIMTPSLTVELHDGNTLALVDTKTAALSSTGAGTFTFSTAVNGAQYYIVVKSFNTIETWSATAHSFSSGTLSYDFTTGLDKAFTDGSNAPLAIHNGKYCIYSGDLDQDGLVTSGDYTGIDNDNFNFDYHAVNDLDGDGIISSGDYTFVDNNNYNFIQKQIPPGAPGIAAKRTIKSNGQKNSTVNK